MAKKFVLKRTGKNGEVKRITGDVSYSINYENLLNPAQYDAACAVEGSYLVIAGAGTGKTRTLTYRVARLIESGYPPESILLLTFTRKAAREMMNRAALLLDSRCAKVNGGTFHSFANITLRKYAKALDLDNGFTILDQGDSEDVINLIRGQMNLTDMKKRFPNKQTIGKILSLHTNTGRSVQDILEGDYPHFLQFTDEIHSIRSQYDSYKKQNNLLDYDDLLIYLKELLYHPSGAAKSLLSGIKFIMVDEYQDTNMLQSEIVKGLAQFNPNVMVVGDDAQSIYSFRGADFKNIMDYPNLFPETEVIKLEENYRSTQSILDFANHIMDGSHEKYTKELYTKKSAGELPAIIAATNENMQSRFIVERILELREEGVPLGDIAVLFRSSYFSFDLEVELNKANIPFIKIGGMKFVETAHVKDVLAFLRIAQNPKDFVSWFRVLLLHEGVGPKRAQIIMDQIAAAKYSIKQDPRYILEEKYSEKLYKLFQVLHTINSKEMLPADRAELVIDYYEPIFVKKYDDFNKRRKDLEILVNIANNYARLDDFLADMALEPPQDSVTDLNETDAENEQLVLSTIHSAKGLEWHTVFVIHAMEGFFPSAMALNSLDSLEEERRLMYVAVTRAKENLYISYPMNIFDRVNGMTFSKPSRFIEGVTEDLAEEWLLEEGN